MLRCLYLKIMLQHFRCYTEIMQLSNFDFDLPTELIAQHPLSKRRASRLLALNRAAKTIQHLNFCDFPTLLKSGDLLVLNDTRVIPARIFAQKLTGGKVEVLMEKVLADGTVSAHLRSSKSLKPGTELYLTDDSAFAVVLGREQDLFVLKLLINEDVFDFLERVGHVPLPPYITRTDEQLDKERYQTVFAKHKGAVAAPTAGLHFDEKLLQDIVKQGVELAYVTLHVGAGTFQPVRVDNILEHKMHAESINVPQVTCDQINATKKRGGRVIAVGTTVVRSLETAALGGTIHSFSGDTDIFIYEGFKFQCVDAMLTNFHLPKSTLLMLICAFAGHDFIMQAYQKAIRQKYRFFSYGDAMMIF